MTLPPLVLSGPLFPKYAGNCAPSATKKASGESKWRGHSNVATGKRGANRGGIIVRKAIFAGAVILISVFAAARIAHQGSSAQIQTQSQTLLFDDPPFRKAANYSREHRGLSILVIKDGKTVFEEYHNGHTATTAWTLASGTKSFSGVILAAAIEDKLFAGFDEKVSETITEWKNDPRRSQITLRQLLQLTSGVTTGLTAVPPTYSAAIKGEIVADAGKEFRYGATAFQIFGEVMRRKLAPRRESVRQYLERRILDPIGASVARWNEQEGQPNLPSGAYMTTREWAKFGLLLLNEGQWEGKRVIRKDLLAELYKGSEANPNYGITFWLNRYHGGETTARVEGAGRRGILRRLGMRGEPAFERVSGYGFGRDLPHDVFAAAGGGNQRLYVIRSRGLLVVRQGRLAKFDDEHFLGLLLSEKSVLP